MSKIKQLAWALLAVYSLLSWAGNTSVKLSRQQIENLGIKLGKLERASRIPLFTAPAKVVVPPSHEFIVSTSQAGLVVKLLASVGDKVAKAQVICGINSADFLTLQGDYLKSLGNLKLASANYNRAKTLVKEGVVSGKNEQEAHSSYGAALIENNEAKQLLQISGMLPNDIKQLENTGKLVGRLNVRSPISGTVLERMVVSGTRVDNMAPLYRIANLDELWLEINVPQEHIWGLSLGGWVLVENTTAEAEIKVLGQSVDPENQSVIAKAIIKVNPSSVRVGQKVTIKYLQATTAESYRLPDVAVAHNGGKAYVFVKDKDGFTPSEISILGKQPGELIITGNFSGDEDIAINNAGVLKANWLGLGGVE